MDFAECVGLIINPALYHPKITVLFNNVRIQNSITIKHLLQSEKIN